MRLGTIKPIFALVATTGLLHVGCGGSQTVRFEAPRGAVVSVDNEPGREVPFTAAIETGTQMRIQLSFTEDILRTYGFSTADLVRVRDYNATEIYGILLLPDSSRIVSVFQVTPQQVRAVLVQNSAIYWRYRDPDNQLILTYEGYPQEVDLADDNDTLSAGARTGIILGLLVTFAGVAGGIYAVTND